MKYRKFDQEGLNTSIIGLGTMRLPVIDPLDPSKIDEPKAIELIRDAIDQGVNYVDTAYIYHGGFSEVIVGKALKDGYREKVTVVDKNPVWLVEQYEDFEKYLDLQLERLDMESIDLYLLHALNQKLWDKIKGLGALKFLEEMKAKGKIKKVGFSFHDDHGCFMNIIDAYPWEMVLLQMNYMDEFEQATLTGLEYAGKQGIPVVVMEPLKGGLLANVPDDIKGIMKDSEVDWSAVEWSFRWLAHRPEVKVILSGMSNQEQLHENVKIGDRLEEGQFTAAHFETVKRIKAQFDERVKVKCTQCNYCMPCPVGVEIPKNFKIYNTASVYDNFEAGSKNYKAMAEKQRASACVGCRQCESHCPQQILISEVLPEVSIALG